MALTSTQNKILPWHLMDVHIGTTALLATFKRSVEPPTFLPVLVDLRDFLQGHAGVEITGFVRLEVGEGIEVEKEDFAAEVAKAVQG